MLNGIDVSSNQPRNICSMVPLDFAIVKATGNPKGMKWDYKNPYMEQQVNEALERTGCAGLYHFTHGDHAAHVEADLFIDHVSAYVGKVILVIDYENEAVKNGREWLRAFMKRIKVRTGINPVVYASSSVIKEQDLIELCKEEDCAIWSANYYAGYKAINGYNMSGLKMDIKDSLLWQYTSSGFLDGYNGALDLDVFYGDKEDWLRVATGNGAVEPSEPESGGSLKVDGYWGKDTTYALQKALGTPQDGIVSGQMKIDMTAVNRGGLESSSWKLGNGGSQVIKALQRKLGVRDDGYFGTITCKALQGYLGTEQDGIVSAPSQMVKELQRRLQSGKI